VQSEDNLVHKGLFTQIFNQLLFFTPFEPIRARICKPFNETRNRFPAWWADTTTLFVIKQKQAIRTVCNANYRDHTAPLFKKLKILPLEKLIEFSKIKFMHNFHFKMLPLSFANTWMSNIERNPERALRNANDLYNYTSHHTEWNLLTDYLYFPSRKHGTLRLVINLTPGNACIL
jgi:hypothetical protein